MNKKIKFLCEKYPEYCTEGIRFSNHTYITGNADEIDKIRRSPIYRGYIKETEIEVSENSLSPVSFNKIDKKEMQELEKNVKETTRTKRGKARQGAVTTESLRKQI